MTIGGIADRGVLDGIGTLVGGAAGSGTIPPDAGLALGAFIHSGVGQRVLGKQFTPGGQMDIDVSSKALINTPSFIYHYRQIADDSGSGAAFGSFRAESFAWGPSLQYITKIKGHDLAMDVKWLHETNAVNRIKGNAIWLNASISL